MAETEEFTVDQQKGEQHPNRSSTSMDDRGHPSTSQRDRPGRYGDDDRSHHRDRDKRDRERNRDRDYSSRYRDRRGSERHKDREDDSERRHDRYRERHRRERHGSRSPVDDRREKSRKRSKSRDRDHYSQRDRSTQNRLSEEIDNELANLRRQHELKEAMRKQQNPECESSDEGKSNQVDPFGPHTAIRRSQTTVAPQPDKRKLDFLSDNQQSAPVEYVPEIQTEEERIEFQRKMQAKLQQHLAAEGKLYPPPPKPREPAPPVVVSGFANDGSFLEMFKQLQQQPIVAANTAAPFGVGAPATGTVPAAAVAAAAAAATATVPFVDTNPDPFKMVPGVPAARPSTLVAQSIAPVAKPTPKEPPPPPLPVFGRRRGGKILKTGMVKKVRPVEETATDAPNDAWSLYLQEVKKYKSASCDADSKTRPLVK
ncbi:RNA-binding protein 25 isoform X2 [Anopheles bellator]|uniref:RNA-binding protein 25 isoform X2 n=1 Tax=Anopheles bellator TaxID=139047 RepID=UPI00264981FA|nr:RNA-binding protein 25 isoform X2 [Anopheles bellator]